MRAHTPPFTKPTGAYDASRLTAREAYDQTSAIAAAQDTKLAMTPAERDAKLRTVAHYIYHAKLLLDEVFGTERAKLAAPPATPDFTIVQDQPDLPLGWLARGGVPVESAYLASFGPNDIQGEVLRECHIGDVTPRHPMHAEALRQHDERLNGPEDSL